MSTSSTDEDISTVRVVVRLRPLNTKELSNGQTVGWQYNNTTVLEQTPNGTKSYKYDRVLGPDSNNEQAYDCIAKQLVVKSLNGYNTTVFAYGQTGSGKTWTMMGDDHGRAPGIIPRALKALFAAIAADQDRDYLLRCSFLELYNESINDLLNTDGTGTNLTITADDPIRGAIISNLKEEVISSVQDGMQLIALGNETRQVSSTSMNARSSRSHTIFRIVLEATKTEAALAREAKLIASLDETDTVDETSFKSFGSQTEKSNTVVSYLNLVDLAGSERQSHTKAEGKQLKEGAAINKSLLALGAVINKLSGGLDDDQEDDSTKKRIQKKSSMRRVKSMRGKKKNMDDHIPYRNSKLTRILRQSLGGSTFTSIVIAMSPAPMYREESRSTLKFGQMCKKIKNKAKKNNVADDKTLLKQYKLEIAKLKEQMKESSEVSAAEATSNNVAVSTKENTELRNKLKILQTMYLGGSSNKSDTSKLDATTLADIEAVNSSRNMWAKMRLGFRSSKSSIGLGGGASSPGRTRRNRSSSIAVGKEGMGALQSMHMLAGIDEESEKSQSLDNAYHEARFKRQSEELIKLKDKTEANLKLLTDLRSELQREKEENLEHRVIISEKTDEIEKMQLVKVKVHELTAVNDSLQAESDRQREELSNLKKQQKEESASAALLLEQQKENLATEEKRCLELTTKVKKLTNQVSQLETQLTAGRKAMQTMQAKILGKSGQRLAIMAVDLEKTVADFQNKQDRLVEEEMKMNRREKELEKRELTVEAKLKHIEDTTATINERFKDLLVREKKVANWKDYANMQEEAFERRDREIDKIGQQQEFQAREIEAREEAVQIREDNVIKEEELLQINREEIHKLGNHVRTQQHDLETRALTVSSATRMQKLVRQLLVKRASKMVSAANLRETELDQREKNIAIAESKVKDDRQQVGNLQIKLSVQQTTNERHSKILQTREQALVRRQKELLDSEKRQRELQVEVEQRHVDAIKRESEIGTIRSSLFGRENTIDLREKKLNEINTKLKSQQHALDARKLKLDEESKTLNENKLMLKKEKNLLENKLSDVVTREEAIKRQDKALKAEKERVRIEWEEARVARDDNELQSKGLSDAKEEYYHMKEDLSKRKIKLQQREQLVLERESNVQQIGPREIAVGLRESKQNERELLFYENTAAKAHSKQKEQIKVLEKCLEEEIHANKKLKILVENLRKNEIARGNAGISEITRLRNNVIEVSGNLDEKVNSGSDIVESEKGESSDNKEASFVVPSPSSVGRLHQARSMIRHLIEENDDIDDVNDIDESDGVNKVDDTHSNFLRHNIFSNNNTFSPSSSKLKVKPKKNKLDLRAERNFRSSIKLLERNAKSLVSGGVSGGSPTKSWSLPWNTWFRVVGGRQECGLSLELFRRLIRRLAKITNCAVSDQDIRRVFELIDINHTGYMTLEHLMIWLYGQNHSKTLSATKRSSKNDGEIIDVTVTL